MIQSSSPLGSDEGRQRHDHWQMAVASRPRSIPSEVCTTLATAVAVVLLATSLLSATVFDPFPYRSAHKLAVLSGTAAPSQGIQGLFGRFVARESTVFQAVEFFQMPETLRIGVERPLSVNAIRVSPGLTSALGVQFLAGRPPSSDREVALSEGLRQRLFGGAPLKSLGATVVISGVIHQIVGILPPKFFFPDNTVEVYLALNGDAAFNLGFVHALVRLKPPVAEALAREQLAALVRHYNRESGARAGAVLHPLPRFDPRLSTPGALGLGDVVCGHGPPRHRERRESPNHSRSRPIA